MFEGWLLAYNIFSKKPIRKILHLYKGREILSNICIVKYHTHAFALFFFSLVLFDYLIWNYAQIVKMSSMCVYLFLLVTCLRIYVYIIFKLNYLV